MPERGAAGTPLGDVAVVVGSPRWTLNGVNVFSERLVRGLVGCGIRAELLVTGGGEHDDKPLPLPADIPVERLAGGDRRGWRARWDRLRRHLEARAPCIWLPNHDYAHSVLAPELPAQVGVVGILHSDDEEHYAHARALGRYWNATVAVSRVVGERAARRAPELGSRLHVVRHGVPLAAGPPRRADGPHAPLRIAYAGRLVQRQKRVLDLPRVLGALRARGVPAELTVAGGGPDAGALRRALAPAAARGEVHFAGILGSEEVRALLGHSDVLLLVSAFEGLPLTVLEAMAAGCVPVVTAVASGVPELVRDGENGFAVPVGDVAGLAERLGALQRDPALRRRLSARAVATLREEDLTLDAMIDRWMRLLGGVAEELRGGGFARPPGRASHLPWMRPGWKERLPPRLRRALARSRRRLAGRAG